MNWKDSNCELLFQTFGPSDFAGRVGILSTSFAAKYLTVIYLCFSTNRKYRPFQDLKHDFRGDTLEQHLRRKFGSSSLLQIWREISRNVLLKDRYYNVKQ
jgi:hypothetical protein